MSRIGLAAALVALFLCGASAQQSTVTVFAASSLTNAMQDIDASFSELTGVTIHLNLGASSVMARKLRRFSAAAVFISADQKWMDYAEAHCRMDRGLRVDLVSNRLVLIAPKSSPIDTVVIAKGLDLAALAGGGRIAVADVKDVPAGIYAKSVLISLGAWEAAQSKLMVADNVRTALAIVALGHVVSLG